MKAVVFAAGIGSRLKPFTDKHPKALAPLGTSTALGLVLKKLVAAGADGIVVNVHHFAPQVIEYIASMRLPVPVEISDESECLLDTGGGLIKMWRESNILHSLRSDEPLIVHNADIYTDFNIKELCKSLEGADAALLADPERHSSRMLLFDKHNLMRAWTNTKTGEIRPLGIDTKSLATAAFGGVHALSAKALEALSTYCGDEIRPFGIMDFYIASVGSLKIRRYTPSATFHWFDIGTPERLAAAQQFVSHETL